MSIRETSCKLSLNYRQCLSLATGDICGSGWQKKPGQNKCKLHTSHVPYEALSEYWTGLPCEQQATLLVLSEEQFVSELDGQMKCQLRICKECR